MKDLKELIIELVEAYGKLQGEIENAQTEYENLDNETKEIINDTDFHDTFNCIETEDIDDIIKGYGAIIGNNFYTLDELREIKNVYSRIKESYNADDIQNFLNLCNKAGHYNSDTDTITYYDRSGFQEIEYVEGYIDSAYESIKHYIN